VVDLLPAHLLGDMYPTVPRIAPVSVPGRVRAVSRSCRAAQGDQLGDAEVENLQRPLW